jgi:hypothetical protein
MAGAVIDIGDDRTVVRVDNMGREGISLMRER